MFVIDKDAPFPEERTKYPFKEMAAGDSVFFDDEAAAAAARVSASRYGALQSPVWVFSLRRTDAREDSRGAGWRLWRMR